MHSTKKKVLLLEVEAEPGSVSAVPLTCSETWSHSLPSQGLEASAQLQDEALYHVLSSSLRFSGARSCSYHLFQSSQRLVPCQHKAWETNCEHCDLDKINCYQSFPLYSPSLTVLLTASSPAYSSSLLWTWSLQWPSEGLLPKPVWRETVLLAHSGAWTSTRRSKKGLTNTQNACSNSSPSCVFRTTKRHSATVGESASAKLFIKKSINLQHKHTHHMPLEWGFVHAE